MCELRMLHRKVPGINRITENHGLRWFFPFVHPERQASDKVNKSEEPASFMRVSFVKGDDRDICLLRIKVWSYDSQLYALTDPSISILTS